MNICKPLNKAIILLSLVLIAALIGGCSSIAATPTSSPSPSPTPTLPPSPTFASGPLYTPSALAFTIPTDQIEYYQYALQLINADRIAANQPPVALSFNAAAQKHARDMFDNYYTAHWGTDGLKPYVRYTLEGGLNYEQENSAYFGWYDKSENPKLYADLDVKEAIKHLEDQMMTNDAKSNWGHRDNIINPNHKSVSIGLAFDNKRIALVHQFEGNYIEYIQPPTISGNTLSLSGKLLLGTLNNVTICWDKYPAPITPNELNIGPYHSYGLGDRLNYLIAPPPPGQYYSSVGKEAIQATVWNVNEQGQFNIEADIAPSLAKGQGVYTIVIVAKVNDKLMNITNYSILVK